MGTQNVQIRKSARLDQIRALVDQIRRLGGAEAGSRSVTLCGQSTEGAARLRRSYAELERGKG
jgi:hypothetical protein